MNQQVEKNALAIQKMREWAVEAPGNITAGNVTVQKTGRLQADGVKLSLALDPASFILDFVNDADVGSGSIVRSSGSWLADGFEKGHGPLIGISGLPFYSCAG